MKNIDRRRLQDKREFGVMPMLLAMLATLGLAAAGWAGQDSTPTPPSASKPNASSPLRAPAESRAAAPLPVAGEIPNNAPARGTDGAPEPMSTASLRPAANGRRDPFKPWSMPGPATGHPPASGPTGVLPAGIKGLVISQLKLEGVVHEEATNSMIALVTNSGKRAYFLRVNDSVHNGMVSKITPDAIYFRENTLDWSGRTSTHEVAIKLGSVRGEGR